MLKYFLDFQKSIRFLKKYVKKNKIDLIDTNTAVVFPGAVVAKRKKIKSVWHIREIISNDLENKVISFLMNRYSDVIIANSKSTANSLRVPQAKVKVIYNAVDTKNIDKIVGTDKQKTITIGMAGRINRWKGQKLFIDAAEILAKKIDNICFVIAGSSYKGEEYIENELKDYVLQKKLNNIISFTGQVDNMDEFYQTLDIFVLPSIKPEPFGLVVIEAMEFEIPVVATNHGGPTEIIKDGVNGFLVDYHDPKDLSGTLEKLLLDENLRKLVGEEGKIKKREQFSILKMVHEIEEVFLSN